MTIKTLEMIHQLLIERVNELKDERESADKERIEARWGRDRENAPDENKCRELEERHRIARGRHMEAADALEKFEAYEFK